MKKNFPLFVALVLLTFALWAVSAASAADTLTIRKLAFAEDIQGLGNYTPRDSARFTLDDVCMIYVETGGFAMPLTPDTEDEYNVDLAVDVAIKLPQTGRLIVFQPDMATLATKVRSELPAYFLGFSFSFEGWTPGNFLLEVGLRDNIGAQIVSQDMAFQLVEP